MNIIIPRQFETLFLYPLSTPLYIYYLTLSTPSIYSSLHPLSTPLYIRYLPLSTPSIYPSLHLSLCLNILSKSNISPSYTLLPLFKLYSPPPLVDPAERTIPIDRPPRRGQHATQHLAHVQPPPDPL